MFCLENICFFGSNNFKVKTHCFGHVPGVLQDLTKSEKLKAKDSYQFKMQSTVVQINIYSKCPEQRMKDLNPLEMPKT